MAKSGKEIRGEGTYIEFETPYVIAHNHYLYDSSETRKEAPSLKIKDIPYMGSGVEAITFELIKTERMTVGDKMMENKKLLRSENRNTIYFVDALLWDEEILRKKTKRTKEMKKNLESNLEYLHNSEKGLLVKTKNNYLMPYNKGDRIITWNDGSDGKTKPHYRVQTDKEVLAISRKLYLG